MSTVVEIKHHHRARVWGPPLAGCPALCVEHVADEEYYGELFSFHRSTLHRHYYPAQTSKWPDGVRTLAVEQTEMGEHSRSAHAVLTLWPGKPDETRQNFNAYELSELIAACRAALEILGGAQ